VLVQHGMHDIGRNDPRHQLADRKSLSRAPAPNTALVRAMSPPVAELAPRRSVWNLMLE
jgi:hypothetical protein